jgi:hypothetical protein
MMSMPSIPLVPHDLKPAQHLAHGKKANQLCTCDPNRGPLRCAHVSDLGENGAGVCGGGGGGGGG